MRAFLFLVLILLGILILSAKSDRQVEQVATRLLYRVLRGRGRGDLCLNDPPAPHLAHGTTLPLRGLQSTGLASIVARGACNYFASSTILNTKGLVCSNRKAISVTTPYFL